jgi:S1-C subfamily serine protease
MVRPMKLLCMVSTAILLSLSSVSIAETLAARYEKQACAVVRIEANNGIGTGFFVNEDGLLITAAHVLFDRSFTMQGTNPALTINAKWPVSLVFNDGSRKQIPLPTLSQRDLENAVFDLVAIETGLKTTCALPIGKPESSKVGDRLLAIGFPGSANSNVLYEGFISSKHTQVPTAVGAIQGTPQLVQVARDVMRVQMPITAGASGSPIITDEDQVIGVISEIPVQWTQELGRLVQAMANNQAGSGVALSGFDITKIVADLAWIVREFESPGAGIAVPLSYVKLPQATSAPKP